MSSKLTQADIDRMRKSAKALRKETGRTHTECLESIAKERGYSSWKHALGCLEDGAVGPSTSGDPFDPAAFLINFESGELDEAEIARGFQHLINTGLAWKLQGTYGRTAERLIEAGVCVRPAGNDSSDPTRVGPYVDVVLDKTRRAAGEELRLLLYGAYNAMGLIGYECNGVAILSNTRMDVICDEIGKMGSGWGGPSTSQIRLFEQLMTCSEDELISAVNTSGRLRRSLGKR